MSPDQEAIAWVRQEHGKHSPTRRRRSVANGSGGGLCWSRTSRRRTAGENRHLRAQVRDLTAAAHLQSMHTLLGTEQGTYRVVTHNTHYTLDLEAKTVTRGRVDNQFADGQRVFPLLEVVVVLVGWSMVLHVLIDGRPDTLRTSEVHAIARIATPVPAPWIQNSKSLGKAHLSNPGEVPVVGVSNLAACGSMVHRVEVVPADQPAVEDRCKRCLVVGMTAGYLSATGLL